MHLKISLINACEVVVDGGVTHKVSRRPVQNLIAHLAIYGRSLKTRSEVACCLWPDSSASQALTNLRKWLNWIRQNLPGFADAVRATRTHLGWADGTIVSIDLLEFEHWARHESEGAALFAFFNQPKPLLLQDLHSEWLEEWRIHLDRLHQLGIQRTVTVLESDSKIDEALELTRRLVHLDDLNESSYRSLMRLLSKQGDISVMKRAYQQCSAALQRNLDVVPSEKTEALYQRLLLNKGGRLSTPVKQRPLIGRAAELKMLGQAWEEALSGRVRLVVLTGMLGVGKTHLLRTFFHSVVEQGYPARQACSYEIESQLAYGVVRSLLRSAPLSQNLEPSSIRELVRVLPQLRQRLRDKSNPGPMTEPWQRWGFYEALSSAMLEGAPTLLWIDDVQWCDQESLEWACSQLVESRLAGLLVILSCRSAHSEDMPKLLSRLATAQARPDVVKKMRLRPLSQKDSITLAKEMAQNQLSEQEAQRLWLETGGNPLLIEAELPQGNQGALESNSGTSSGQSTLARRMAHYVKTVAPESRMVLELAAVTLIPRVLSTQSTLIR